MHDLTVADASGIIAAAIHLLQFIIPNMIIMILASVIKTEHSAVTCSVVGRALHSSSWPVILRSDTAASKSVDRSVAWLTWLKAASFGLLAIAAISTPLGLYESIEASRSTTLARFVYVSDDGPMGYGTPPRSDQGFSRSCGDFFPMACPGQDFNITLITNSTGNYTEWNGTYDVRIPLKIAEIFQSGLKTQKPTVASFFDIESRQYGFFRQGLDGVNNNSAYIVDFFRQVNSVILDDSLEVFEGVIVDTQRGAVGFRNHTVPQVDGIAAEWTEEILFIEPETECVDLNITIDFVSDGGYGLPIVSIVDHGGFHNLTLDYPEIDLSNPQVRPILRERAYKAAWLSNAYMMLYFNVTRPSPHAFAYVDSYPGKRFRIEPGPSAANPNVWTSTTLGDSLLILPSQEANGTIFNSTSDPATNYTNPFGITSSNFSDIDVVCSGAGGMNIANSSTIAVKCGQMIGTARRTDGRNPLIFQPNTSWSQSVFTCASTTKALLKVVRFRYNSTSAANLRNLKVLDIRDKVYGATEEMPAWGVENLDMPLHDASQLWGLVDNAYQDSANLSIFRKPSLYLPGYTGLADISNHLDYQYLPAATAPLRALGSAYEVSSGSSGSLGVKDYSALTDAALFTKWQALSHDAASTSKIVNLIWTDITANSLIGTRSWTSRNTLPPNLAGTNESVTDILITPQQVPVTIFNQRLRYHWPYAVPALLFLILAAGVMVVALGCSVRGSMGRRTMRTYLDATSPGRLLVAIQDGAHAGEDQSSTKEWVRTKGKRIVPLSHRKQAMIPLSSMSDGSLLLSGYEHATTAGRY